MQKNAHFFPPQRIVTDVNDALPLIVPLVLVYVYFSDGSVPRLHTWKGKAGGVVCAGLLVWLLADSGAFRY